MIDRWFGWHLPHTERYRLWHPVAHVRAVVKEDRSALVGKRECDVNNTSFVDETIGPVLMKLAITFLPRAARGRGIPILARPATTRSRAIRSRPDSSASLRPASPRPRRRARRRDERERTLMARLLPR